MPEAEILRSARDEVAPTVTSKWRRYLADLQGAASETLPLETQGRLVRVTGLVLEAAGIRVPVGSVCEIHQDGRPGEGAVPVLAEVVGFSGDRAYLMPTGDVHGLTANYLMLTLIGLHVAAALYHYFIRRDGVLQRMLPHR